MILASLRPGGQQVTVYSSPVYINLQSSSTKGGLPSIMNTKKGNVTEHGIGRRMNTAGVSFGLLQDPSPWQ